MRSILTTCHWRWKWMEKTWIERYHKFFKLPMNRVFHKTWPISSFQVLQRNNISFVAKLINGCCTLDMAFLKDNGINCLIFFFQFILNWFQSWAILSIFRCYIISDMVQIHFQKTVEWCQLLRYWINWLKHRILNYMWKFVWEFYSKQYRSLKCHTRYILWKYFFHVFTFSNVLLNKFNQIVCPTF